MRVHDSQAYRKMAVTRERISRILELRETLLSFQTGFNCDHLTTAIASELAEGQEFLELILLGEKKILQVQVKAIQNYCPHEEVSCRVSVICSSNVRFVHRSQTRLNGSL